MNKIFSDQYDWDELLEYISGRNLTTVLGKEMYIFKDADTQKPLDIYLARKLLELHKATDFQCTSLTEAVNYLEIEKKFKTMDIIRKLKSIVTDINFEMPLLTEFLNISDLNYFINTTVYNNILEKKISDIRNQAATSINFSISADVKDFPDLEKLEAPYIFNVFGSLLKTIDVALSEEDILEYTHSFNLKMAGATNIVSSLKTRPLLFLGCSFPDWIVRFVMRLLANEPMHEWGSKRTIIIINDPGESRNEQFEFLKNYEVVTYEGSTAEFVHELSNQWKKRNPNTGKGKSIFLSYTREDMPAVENIKKGIESIGNVTCWYDKRELEPGDDWREKIVVSIRKADLFMPLISVNSLEHEDGYVQKEWSQGTNEWVYRNADKKNGKYLIPVVIDDSPLYSDKISKHFDPKINISKIPQGNPDKEFLNDIKKILNLD